MSFDSSSRVGRWVLSRFWTLRPSGSPTCPRSSLRTSLRDGCVASRSWCNSWWKCQLSCTFLSRKLTFQFLVVEGDIRIFKGFPPGQSSTAPQFSEERISKRIGEQNVDIPGVGLQGLRPVQGSTASSSSSLPRSPTDWLNSEDKAFQWVFRTFSPPNKIAKVTRHSSARVPRSASSSELSAHQMARAARP